MKKVFMWLLILTVSLSIMTLGSLSGCKATTTETTTETTVTAETTAAPATTAAETTAVETTAPKKEIKIAFVQLTDTNPFHIGTKEAAIKAAEAYGVTLINKVSEGKLENEIAVIDSLIEQKVDVIADWATDERAIGPMVEKCKKAGIAFIATFSKTANPDCFSSSLTEFENNYMNTYIAASYLGFKGGICYLGGRVGNFAAMERERGFKTAMEELTKQYPDLKLLSYQNTEWDPVVAKQVTENWLTQFPKIDAIMCASDSLLYTSMEAIKAAGRDKEIALFGHDGDPEGVQFVKDGTFKSDVLIGPSRVGWWILRQAYAISTGLWTLENHKDDPLITPLVMTDEVAKQCYKNGLSAGVKYITPEEAQKQLEDASTLYGPQSLDAWKK